MNRSFTIIKLSAARTSLQLLPKTFRVEDATPYPWRSIRSSRMPPFPMLVPWMYHPPVHPPPSV